MDTHQLVERTLERAFAGMDKDGFFPPTPCKACGTMLSSADGPRPAETYAGTANWTLLAL